MEREIDRQGAIPKRLLRSVANRFADQARLMATAINSRIQIDEPTRKMAAKDACATPFSSFAMYGDTSTRGCFHVPSYYRGIDPTDALAYHFTRIRFA